MSRNNIKSSCYYDLHLLIRIFYLFKITPHISTIKLIKFSEITRHSADNENNMNYNLRKHTSSRKININVSINEFKILIPIISIYVRRIIIIFLYNSCFLKLETAYMACCYDDSIHQHLKKLYKLCIHQ